MNDSYRTISTMTAMAGLSSSQPDGNDELLSGETLLDLTSKGRILGRIVAENETDNDNEEALCDEIRLISTHYHNRSQINAILSAFCDDSFQPGAVEEHAQTFAVLKQSAIEVEDFASAADVDAALLLVADRYRTVKGEAEAQRFLDMADYCLAGATLGRDLALALYAGDNMLVESIQTKVTHLNELLADSREMRDAFSTLFRHYSQVS